MNNIGFMVRAVSMSQEGLFLINECNKLLEKDRSVEVNVFYEDYDRIPTKPEFSLMQNRNAWGYNGILIATDIHTTEVLQHLVGPSRKMLYVWNLEWLYTQNMYTSYSKIYQSKDIDLIARTPSHFDIIKKLWKEPKYIMEDFDHEQLARIIKESR
jgi:hypothetical protein